MGSLARGSSQPEILSGVVDENPVEKARGVDPRARARGTSSPFGVRYFEHDGRRRTALFLLRTWSLETTEGSLAASSILYYPDLQEEKAGRNLDARVRLINLKKALDNHVYGWSVAGRWLNVQ